MRPIRQLGAAVAIATGAMWAVSAVAGVPGQGSWETTLQARDLDSNGVADAFYDTELNITWLRNANVNSIMPWDIAKNWANNLVVGAYSDWRLPTMIDTGTSDGYNVQTKSGSTVYSEMAHLWYVELGNKAYFDTSGNQNQPGWGLTNTGDFENLQGHIYYSGLEYAPDRALAWNFSTIYGFQSRAHKNEAYYAMAVRPGDVGAVPEPLTLALTLAGLGAVALMRGRGAQARHGRDA